MLKHDFPMWQIKPRDWQVEALGQFFKEFSNGTTSGVISAIMGSGKSLLIAEICGCLYQADDEVIVVSTSTQDLVDSLSRDIGERLGYFKSLGQWYSRKKTIGSIVVTCVPSVKNLAAHLKKKGKKVILWIADEAHRTECDSILKSYKLLNPEHSLGMTATPFRSEKNESITLFDKVIYRYGIKEAMDDKIVVPWRIENYDKGSDDLNVASLDMIKNAKGPGLVNAASIDDARDFAQFLNDNGMRARAVHSRMSWKDRKEIMILLKSGLLNCVVHVNLLSEGANYPFLRWMLLRRQVLARVRFIQEIGRLLRSFPGKEYATFYDPHDLFGTFKLTYEEALGLAPEKKKVEEMLLPEEIAERFIYSDPPVVMHMIESCIRSLVVASEAEGFANRRIIQKYDRLRPARPLQLTILSISYERVIKNVPYKWQVLVEKSMENLDCIRFGFAADLIWVLNSVAFYKIWPKTKHIPVVT